MQDAARTDTHSSTCFCIACLSALFWFVSFRFVSFSGGARSFFTEALPQPLPLGRLPPLRVLRDDPSLEATAQLNFVLAEESQDLYKQGEWERDMNCICLVSRSAFSSRWAGFF